MEDRLLKELSTLCPGWARTAIAVGVSGGPDSMALCAMLSALYARGQGAPVHAITVDHNLRAEAADEAVQVGRWIADWPGVTHHILTRPKPDGETRVMERARDDRYAMMQSLCDGLGCAHLFIAHHQGDQAETILFRLAKGSGVDGLSGMAPLTPRAGGGAGIVRPLLSWPKVALVDYCAAHDVPFFQDPSNQNTDYARPRLRMARDILAREGLSERRLARTAERLARARGALAYYADLLWNEALLEDESDPSSRVFDFARLQAAPPEMMVRILSRALAEIGGSKGGYGPRMERVERLCADISETPDFTRATLFGCLITLKNKRQLLRVEKEGKKA